MFKLYNDLIEIRIKQRYDAFVSLNVHSRTVDLTRMNSHWAGKKMKKKKSTANRVRSAQCITISMTCLPQKIILLKPDTLALFYIALHSIKLIFGVADVAVIIIIIIYYCIFIYLIPSRVEVFIFLFLIKKKKKKCPPDFSDFLWLPIVVIWVRWCSFVYILFKYGEYTHRTL